MKDSFGCSRRSIDSSFRAPSLELESRLDGPLFDLGEAVYGPFGTRSHVIPLILNDFPLLLEFPSPVIDALIKEPRAYGVLEFQSEQFG
jgi:hypothetical protein